MNSTIGNHVHELVLANKILAREDVMDAFGHVSIRHPERADRFFLAAAKAPELVESVDVMEHDLNGEPVDAAGRHPYSERYIHSEIYRSRPDVNAICHHHNEAIMPFCITGAPLLPVYQHGALVGEHVPLWDSRDEFGDTNLLVSNAEQGRSLARALGNAKCVLMRHHGATVVGAELRELVFRSVAVCRNAGFQYRALTLGPVTGLTAGEASMAAKVPQGVFNRAWDLWAKRIQES